MTHEAVNLITAANKRQCIQVLSGWFNLVVSGKSLLLEVFVWF